MFGFFKSKKYKKEIEILKSDLKTSESKARLIQKELDSIKLTQEQLMFLDLQEQINDLLKKKQQEIINLQTIKNQSALEIENERNILQLEIDNLKSQKELANTDMVRIQNRIDDLKKELSTLNLTLDNGLEMQSYGFYEPKYGFEDSIIYKSKLDEIRSQQKDLVKKKVATHHNTDYLVDGDKKRGKEFILDTVKLSLRAFNNECDNIISKVKYNNIYKSRDRIAKIFNEINALTDMQRVSIKVEYLDLKIEELYLKYEYECKKQEEKEEQQAIKERMREEAKVLKEIEAAKNKIEKEETHFKNAINALKVKIEQTSKEEEKEKLEEKLYDLEDKLYDLELCKEDILEREKNTRAGYVYIISNIGSFGENVYKIGMTRRLDPTERVRELGSASVPFRFDIHAMIFSEDAPELENKLHKRFANRQVNKVNTRKEFFNVTLAEIEDVVTNEFDKPVEFTRLAEAEEYRQTLALIAEAEKEVKEAVATA